MSENIEELPRVFIHCDKTYKMMYENRSTTMHEGKPVYRGHLTKDMYEYLGLTTAQYSRVVDMLVEMGCIHQLKRGAGKAPSEWVLIGAPTYESFAYVKGEQLKRTHKQKRPEEQRISDLIGMINTLSHRIEKLEREVYG